MALASVAAGAPRRRRSTYATALGALAIGVAACGSPPSRPLGDSRAAATPSAQSALQGAARVMQSEPSYNFAATVSVPPTSVQVTGRFQAPDRLDELIQVSGHRPVRALLVGSRTFVQDPTSGAWRASGTTGGAADPRGAFSVLLHVVRVSRAGNLFRFTVPAASVAQLVPGLTAGGPATGSAQTAGGALSHLSVDLPSPRRPVTISLDYRSLGQAPPVTVPPGVG